MVKMLTGIAGDGFSYAPGEKASFDKETEKRLIESGQAEAVKAAPKEKAKSE